MPKSARLGADGRRVIRVRRSRSLVVTWSKYGLQVTDFVSRQSFSCNSFALDILAKLSNWTILEDFVRELLDFSPSSVLKEVSELIAVGAVVVEGSKEAALDVAYEMHWEWGPLAGLFHFGVRDAKYLNDYEAEIHIRKRASIRPAPQNYLLNQNSNKIYQFEDVDLGDPVFRAMAARRTVRAFDPKPMNARQLGDCLFAGLGVVGFYKHHDLGTMPVKFTPSGGARNPYEAYIYVQNVSGLSPGVYHYSAVQHNLELLGGLEGLHRPGAILSGQDWTDNSAAVVLLVANFDRTMWKYENPTAYRVVMIEAGHIAQNIQISAAKEGLCANPTSAIQDSLAEEVLRIGSPAQSVIYALSLGYPDEHVKPE